MTNVVLRNGVVPDRLGLMAIPSGSRTVCGLIAYAWVDLLVLIVLLVLAILVIAT